MRKELGGILCRNLTWTVLMLFISGLLLQSCSSQRQKAQKDATPIAIDGFLDLTSWNFNEGEVYLNGDWEFYPNQLLYPGDFTNPETITNRTLLTVPSTWEKYKADGHGAPLKGFATYRLLFNTVEQSQLFIFRLGEIHSAYSMFVNGKLLASLGKVGESKDAYATQMHPQVSGLFKPDLKNEIVLQLSNFEMPFGGLASRVEMGIAKRILHKREKSIIVEALLFGAILIMGIYHLGHYLLKRNDYSSLYFAIFCLILAVRTLAEGEKILIHHFPIISFEVLLKIDYLTFYLGLPFFSRFVWSVFHIDFSKKVLWMIELVSLVFAVTVLALPSGLFAGSLPYYQLFTVFVGFYLLFAIIKATFNKREGALLYLLGTFFLFLTVLNDILVQNYTMQGVDLVPTGMFFFIVFQTLFLSGRFSRAFIKIEKLSEDIGRKNQELLEMDRLKDEFMENTSLELKGPIDGIIRLVDSMLTGASGILPRKQKENLSMISTSGKRLASLINDLLDVCLLKYDKLKLNQRGTDIRSIAEIVLEPYLSPERKKKQLTLSNKIQPGLPFIYADEERTYQILHNLINSIYKYSERGEITISAEWKREIIRISINGSETVFPENLRASATGYFDLDNANQSPENKRSSLGLMITKKLVELHSGELFMDINSEPGVRFDFTLPVVHQPDEEELPKRNTDITLIKKYTLDDNQDFNHMNSSSGSTIDEKRQDQARILLIDRDPVNTRTIQNYLGTDYDISSNADVDDAFRQLQENQPFDLVLLDLTMPRKNGYEICRELRKEYDMNQLPIIVQTLKSNVDDVNKALDYGANDYIIKPFSQIELNARIKTHLRNREVVHLKEKVNTLLGSQQDEFRETLVNLLSNSLDYWTRTTQKTKFDLAQESGLWKLYLDKSTFKTRTMDKYLNINTLPKKPRSENVIKTAEFVLTNCPTAEPWKKELEDLLARLKQLMLKKLKN